MPRRSKLDESSEVARFVALAVRAEIPFRELVALIRREYIAAMLDAHDDNQGKVARILGVHRNLVSREMKK